MESLQIADRDNETVQSASEQIGKPFTPFWIVFCDEMMHPVVVKKYFGLEHPPDLRSVTIYGFSTRRCNGDEFDNIDPDEFENVDPDEFDNVDPEDPDNVDPDDPIVRDQPYALVRDQTNEVHGQAWLVKERDHLLKIQKLEGIMTLVDIDSGKVKLNNNEPGASEKYLYKTFISPEGRAGTEHEIFDLALWQKNFRKAIRRRVKMKLAEKDLEEKLQGEEDDCLPVSHVSQKM